MFPSHFLSSSLEEERRMAKDPHAVKNTSDDDSYCVGG